ncbi:MAG: TVP38/TMEM64 family protein [Candidatus Hodarchaeales archaeon]|jgi:uncharacterized membrane protein YdjX (TVP38/TMEM64 family)
MTTDIFLTFLDPVFDIFLFIWTSLNEILLDLVETFGVWGLIIAMVFQSIVAPIISEAVLTAAGFGFYNAYGNEGLILAFIGGIIGSLLGAVIAFYIARGVQSLLRKRIVDVYGSKNDDSESGLNQKNPYLTRIANFLARFIDEDSEYFLDLIEDRGFFFVLIGRLAPFIPFDAVSYGAGFTRIGFWSYFIPTIIGTVPRVLFYILLGAGLVSWAEEDLNIFFLILLAFAIIILGLYLLSMRFLKKRVRGKRDVEKSENE